MVAPNCQQHLGRVQPRRMKGAGVYAVLQYTVGLDRILYSCERDKVQLLTHSRSRTASRREPALNLEVRCTRKEDPPCHVVEDGLPLSRALRNEYPHPTMPQRFQGD